MIRWMHTAISITAHAAGAVGVAICVCASAAEPAQGSDKDAPRAAALPVERFYRHPDVAEARLSPSGKRVALAVSVSQRLALAVIDLSTDAAPKLVASLGDSDIARFEWVNDERLVFETVDLEAGSGDQVRAPGLFSVAADGSELRQLVRVRGDFVVNSGGTRTNREPLEANHRLLAIPLCGGDDVIVGRYQLDAAFNVQSVIPLRLNVVTQRASLPDLDLPAGVTSWLFDPQGTPRVGVASRGGEQIVHWRAPGAGAWRELSRSPVLASSFAPAAVDADGQLYVVEGEANAARTTVLKRFDFKSGRPEARASVSTAGFDFSGAFVRDLPAEGECAPKVLGVRIETDAESTAWLDDRVSKLQRAADEKLPGRVNRITCRRCTKDDAVVLVHSWSAQEPGQFWLYRPATSQWRLLARVRGDIDARTMASLEFHRFKARDGVEIPVWITLPNGQPDAQPSTPQPESNADPSAKPPKPRPAVVLVHGGPWVRGGHWRWDEDAQFLASRGYVVIEPEFRGSTGYGRRLFEAGWRQWGRAMQDDLADAVRWAADQGLVDKSRVCIAGASYGGYAALMGLVRDPDLYRCAIAWVAVTDPRLLYELAWLSDMTEDVQRYRLPTLVGDPVADAEMLKAASPLAQAARIKAPLLLAYGGRDRRVPLAHGERLRAALKEAGRDPEWVVYPDEGHGWLRPQNRYDFARRMEWFLAEHLR